MTPESLVPRIVTVNEPCVVGVPDKTPVPLARVMPVGREPCDTEYVTRYPLAAKVNDVIAVPTTRTVWILALFDVHTGAVVTSSDAADCVEPEPFESVAVSAYLRYLPASPTIGTYDVDVAPAMSVHVTESEELCHRRLVTVTEPVDATHVGALACIVEPTAGVPLNTGATVAVGPFGYVKVTTPFPSLNPCVCTMLE